MLRVVTTETGIIQGLPAADPRITSFKGIPFAAPPTGSNRWRAPQPAPKWEGVLKAFEFAPISMQSPVGLNKTDIYTREWAVDPDIIMNEDCLYLNVWTPACSTEEKLPVFVWYFGGLLQVGNTAEMEFDGERIARRGIVVVTINYRLNVFGFLCHPEITAEAPEAPANFGHLDQQAGTQWVKRNIAAFGGDPHNITIGGQSAGGGSVLNQLTSPQNKDLFQKAFIESGMITNLYPGNLVPIPRQNLFEAEQEGEKFFELLGITSLAEARMLDAEYINSKSLEHQKFWGTVIDHIFCLDSSYDLFVANKRWRVPILWGNTSNEFFNIPKAETLEEFAQMAKELFGDDSDEFLSICHSSTGDIKEVISKATVNGIEYATRVASQGHFNTDGTAPMYYYIFDAEIPGWDNPGTFHSVDLWFYFETLAKCWRPFVGKHYDLARQMCNYLANFISTGNPNGKDSTGEDLTQWEPYTREAPFRMVFTDKAEFSKEGPSDIMKFLMKEYFKNQNGDML